MPDDDALRCCLFSPLLLDIFRWYDDDAVFHYFWCCCWFFHWLLLIDLHCLRHAVTLRHCWCLMPLYYYWYFSLLLFFFRLLLRWLFLSPSFRRHFAVISPLFLHYYFFLYFHFFHISFLSLFSLSLLPYFDYFIDIDVISLIIYQSLITY